MQVIEFTQGTLRFLQEPPAQPPAEGFVWLVMEREALEQEMGPLQSAAQALGASPLLDLHVRDLRNPTHPPNYDYTSVYDVVVFHRLASAAEIDAELGRAPGAADPLGSFRRVRTRAVAFAVFDRLLVTVHPAGCTLAQSFLQRYLADAVYTDALGAAARSPLPAGPSDLMLRMLNVMVDGFLDLRKQLSADLSRWQEGLLRPGSDRVARTDWNALMTARSQLHHLEDLCEEQNDAVQEWLDTAREQPPPSRSQAEHDALLARASDVIEHIQRVVHQVRRMEQGAEAVVQIHFSALSHRMNTTMRTLTALTALFLPLNLITGIFGMNFTSMPLLQEAGGFWMAMGGMAAIALGLGLVFWRKRYLARSGR